MNLTKEEIIQEIRNGTPLGQEIFEIELSYYKDLAKDKTEPEKVGR